REQLPARGARRGRVTGEPGASATGDEPMWVGELPSGTVTGLAFAPDGSTLYTGNNHGLLLAWDRGTQQPRELLQLPLINGVWARITRILPSPDGRTVRVPTTNPARLDTLDPRTGKPLEPPWHVPPPVGWYSYYLVTAPESGDLLLAA